MYRYKAAAVYVLIIFFCGCATKKKVTEKIETSKSDTLIVKTETIERPPILSSLTIEEICDTITGKPKIFKQVFVVDGDTLQVSIQNNELKIENNLLKKVLSKKDSIIAIRDTQYKEVKTSETVRNVIPFKYWVWLIVSILGNIALLYFMFRKKLPF